MSLTGQYVKVMYACKGKEHLVGDTYVMHRGVCGDVLLLKEVGRLGVVLPSDFIVGCIVKFEYGTVLHPVFRTGERIVCMSESILIPKTANCVELIEAFASPIDDLDMFHAFMKM